MTNGKLCDKMEMPNKSEYIKAQGMCVFIFDFTSAAQIAAFYSKAQGDNIAVDYTLAKHIKKPAGAKLGFVIYKTNYTAYVTPDGDEIAKWRK